MLVRLHRNETTNANQFKRYAFGNERTAKKEKEKKHRWKSENAIIRDLCTFSLVLSLSTC